VNKKKSKLKVGLIPGRQKIKPIILQKGLCAYLSRATAHKAIRFLNGEVANLLPISLLGANSLVVFCLKANATSLSEEPFTEEYGNEQGFPKQVYEEKLNNVKAS